MIVASKWLFASWTVPCVTLPPVRLFEALADVLQKRDIPWKNVVGFVSDSASVMVGRRNSVLSRVCEQQPNVFSLGCICHLAALCAAAALKKLPLSIDGLLIDVFYHFKHSSKRCHEFAEVLRDFEGIAPLQVVKHCSTRWLSLERAVRRLLTLWPALCAYFDRERGVNDCTNRVADALMSVETKLWFLFVAYALKHSTLPFKHRQARSAHFSLTCVSYCAPSCLISSAQNALYPSRLQTSTNSTTVMWNMRWIMKSLE